MLQHRIGRPIYLDYHATTPVDPRVAASVLNAMTTTFGNANSVDHLYGEEAAALIDAARGDVAALVGGDADGVHFTSGASESIQLAVRHAALGSRSKGRLRVVMTAVEHRAVFDVVAALEDSGEANVRYIPVDSLARLDLDALEDACAAGADLVCVMAANNEVGTLYPIERVAQIARSSGASTLVDATQAAGRIPLRAEKWGVTYLALSAHKMYGPKGVGALVTPPALRVRDSHGVARGTGNGTPNVPGIVGLGESCRLRRLEMDIDEPRVASLRDKLEALLVAGISDSVVNGDRSDRLSGNLHISVPDAPHGAIVARLRRHVALSTGAACMSGAQTPSHVLRAMGLAPRLQTGALRLGLGKFTQEAEIEEAALRITSAVRATRRAVAVTMTSQSAGPNGHSRADYRGIS